MGLPEKEPYKSSHADKSGAPAFCVKQRKIMLISESFASFKAKQKNVQWSVSAISEDDELVVSLWDQFFEKRSKGTMTYVDKVSRWKGLVIPSSLPI